MAKQQQKSKGGNKKIGRDQKKCELYRARKQKERNALRHMLKSNRYADVLKYAQEHGLKAPAQPERIRKLEVDAAE